jgi:hypothetical protein
MKAALLATLLLISQLAPVSAQTPARVPALKLRLGAVTVELPTPAGFDEAASRFERVKTFFSATEDPNNEMLAVHLPLADVARLERNEQPEMNFYTKVSVSRRSKETSFDASQLADLISVFEKQGLKLLDTNNPELKEKMRRAEDAANDLNKDSTLKMSAPEYLGEFDRTPNTFGVMIMARVSIESGGQTKQVLMLCAASFVMVRSRLIYVYAYRRYDSEADLTTLKDFARKWSAQIVAANRS